MPSLKDLVGQSSGWTPVTPAFVKGALQSSGLGIRKSNKSWFIVCPFHSDSAPSLSIVVESGHTQSPGFWKCFGCGAQGHWNKLATALRLPTMGGFDYEVQDEGGYIDFQMPDDKEPERIHLQTWPEGRPWRGFSGKVINRFDGFHAHLDMDYPLLLVCKNVEGDTVGSIRCRGKRNSKDELGYIFSSGSWVSKYLWPEFHISETKSVIIVEGIRDALSCMARGFPTFAVLGVSSGFGQARLNTLSSLGIENIVLFLDGDRAGEEGANGNGKKRGIASMLGDDFNVKVFKTWEWCPKKDPFKLMRNPSFAPKFRRWLRR